MIRKFFIFQLLIVNECFRMVISFASKHFTSDVDSIIVEVDKAVQNFSKNDNTQKKGSEEPVDETPSPDLSQLSIEHGRDDPGHNLTPTEEIVPVQLIADDVVMKKDNGLLHLESGLIENLVVDNSDHGDLFVKL